MRRELLALNRAFDAKQKLLMLPVRYYQDRGLTIIGLRFDMLASPGAVLPMIPLIQATLDEIRAA